MDESMEASTSSSIFSTGLFRPSVVTGGHHDDRIEKDTEERIGIPDDSIGLFLCFFVRPLLDERKEEKTDLGHCSATPARRVKSPRRASGCASVFKVQTGVSGSIKALASWGDPRTEEKEGNGRAEG